MYKNNKISLGIIVVFLLVSAFKAAHCQYLFSATANGQGAYLASSLKGQSLIANPAFVVNNKENSSEYLQLEGYLSKKSLPTNSEFPNFEFVMPISAKISVALRRQFNFPSVATSFNRSDRYAQNIPVPINLDRIEAHLQKPWIMGCGAAVGKNVSIGLTATYLKYNVMYLSHYTYFKFDAGSVYAPHQNLRLGMVLRNLFPIQTHNGDFDYIIRDVNTGDLYKIRWRQDYFSLIRSKPDAYGEIGLSYILSRSLEFLLDFSSRNEYAWGVHAIFSKYFSLFGGYSKREDELYKNYRLRSTTLGLQLRIKLVTATISGIVRQGTGDSRLFTNYYGRWQVFQEQHDELLFSLGFDL